MQSVLVSICQICHGLLLLLYAHQELLDSARLSGWCCSCSKSIILFLRGSAGAIKIRWVFIDWRQEATYQLSLFLRAITLNCDLQILLHSTSLERCQSRCQSRCPSMLILMTWLTTWLMTYTHQRSWGSKSTFFVVLSTELYTCESLSWLPTWDLPGRHKNVTCQARLCNGWLRLACNDAMLNMWGSARVQPMLFPAY